MNVALAVDHVLGEGPRWVEATGEVAWVDVEMGLVRRGRLDGTALVDVTTTSFPEPVGFVAPCADGSLIVGTGTHLVALTADGDQHVLLSLDHPSSHPVRWNDGFVDPAGRIWAGVMGRGAEPGAGALYRIDRSGATRVLDGLTIPNGMGWSPDHRTMYVTESVRQRIDAHSFDVESGDLGPAEAFIEIAGSREGGGDLGPDGLCTDSEGAVWTAIWGGGEVRRYLPDGTLDRRIAVPATQTTSCALCGQELRTLVITSARRGLDTPQPTDGFVFAIEVDVPGVAPTVPVLFA